MLYMAPTPWLSEKKKMYAPLQRDLAVDVAVIGGGMAGILTAYLLAREARSVVIFETAEIGGGATGYTTAFLTQSIDTDLSELVSLFGERTARLVWESGASAIDAIEDIARRWTGPILEPTDGFPLIGTLTPGKFVATAFSGTGMTYSAVSDMIIRDRITGRHNEWSAIYDPKRSIGVKKLYRKDLDYTREFIGGAVKNSLRRKK